MLDINEINEPDVATDIAILLDGKAMGDAEYSAASHYGNTITITVTVDGESRCFYAEIRETD